MFSDVGMRVVSILDETEEDGRSSHSRTMARCLVR